MKKYLIIILLVIIVILAGVIIARNTIIKSVIEDGVHKIIGQKLSVGGIDAGILKTDLDIRALNIFNPEGYTDELLADIPRVYINYSLFDIIKGFLHFPEINLKIKQLNVEKDKNGVLNVDHFKPPAKEEEHRREEKEKPKEEKKFLIDKLFLEIDTIRYKDNTKTPPQDQEIKINLSKTLTSVNSPDVIVSLIVSEAINKLVAEGIKDLTSSLQKALETGDFKGFEEQMGKDSEGIGKQLGIDLPIMGGKGESAKPAKPSSEKEKEPSVEKIFGDLFGTDK